jgi:hypothetical protein
MMPLVSSATHIVISDPSGVLLAVAGIVGTLIAGIGGTLLGQKFESSRSRKRGVVEANLRRADRLRAIYRQLSAATMRVSIVSARIVTEADVEKRSMMRSESIEVLDTFGLAVQELIVEVSNTDVLDKGSEWLKACVDFLADPFEATPELQEALHKAGDEVSRVIREHLAELEPPVC